MFKKLLDKITAGNTLYYPGCLTHYALPEIEENYKKILTRLKIDFITIPEFKCCGSPAKHAGYSAEYETLKEKNEELFKKYGISRIITSCPACFYVLKDYGLDVEHVTQTLYKKLDALESKHSGEITYHDPCHLGRHSNVYDEPRCILEKVGFTLVEMHNSQKKALCCGGGAGLKTNYPELANKVAKARLNECKTKKLVTTCPLCYAHFKENSSNTEVLELSEVLL